MYRSNSYPLNEEMRYIPPVLESRGGSQSTLHRNLADNLSRNKPLDRHLTVELTSRQGQWGNGGALVGRFPVVSPLRKL